MPALALLGALLMTPVPGGGAPAAGQTVAGGCTGDLGAPLKLDGEAIVCAGRSLSTVVNNEQPQPGAQVVSVVKGGRLEAAGLLAGDVVYRVGGARVTSGDELIERWKAGATAGTLVVNFWRDGKPYLIRLWTR